MRKIKCLIVFIGIISMLIVGCSKDIEDREQSIEVQKLLGDENNYEYLKEVTNNDQVKKVREILDDIVWENAQVSMVRPADYRFGFQYKNPKIEAKAVLYELWIGPKKDQVELVIDAESKYAQLDNNKSAILFEIITGEKLSDLN